MSRLGGTGAVAQLVADIPLSSVEVNVDQIPYTALNLKIKYLLLFFSYVYNI